MTTLIGGALLLEGILLDDRKLVDGAVAFKTLLRLGICETEDGAKTV